MVEAPPSAGLLVIAADRGGSIRETLSMAKAHGASGRPRFPANAGEEERPPPQRGPLLQSA